ncbi:L-serine ammonia-lyase [Corynebacterium anserum]|uniref:L-serine ammonia-lyase n=1 Tax=Corynebacterium anserum TaxID=2684406 RepID=UPI001FEC428A|nr:L-serine ammonia-lyase [Corynebacterium anserum]
MTVSVFDLFQIGVGPSSSHTVGPMRAGLTFATELRKEILAGRMDQTGGEAASRRQRASSLRPLDDEAKLAGVVTPHREHGTAISIILYGSLAATGMGHGTLEACLLGLDGADPGAVDPDFMETRIREIRRTRQIRLAGDENLPVTCGFEDIILRPAIRRSIHTNAVTFVGFEETSHGHLSHDGEGVQEKGGQQHKNGEFTSEHGDGSPDDRSPHRAAYKETYYSIGGGFIRTEDHVPQRGEITGKFVFDSAEKLLRLCDGTVGEPRSISSVQLECERTLRTDEEINVTLDSIAQAMQDCAKRGMASDGVLPGMLQVRRRAKRWYDQLMDEDPQCTAEFSEDWVNLVALAVNEENAAGGRVVTAPTNGAAGIIPAVMFYARNFTDAGRRDPRATNRKFLLAAGAVGSLYKERASISGAEVGCQGEVGSAASMAAAGLAEVLGGTPQQVANAAEIAMEHSLGLTCDPIGGLVQIPCIERNAISAGKAINAAKMALRGDGKHHVTLDEVIETMRQTGRDMSDKYKETAGGGLATNVAVNVPEC